MPCYKTAQGKLQKKKSVKIGGTCRGKKGISRSWRRWLAGNYHHFKTISILILNVIEFQRCRVTMEDERRGLFGKTRDESERGNSQKELWHKIISHASISLSNWNSSVYVCYHLPRCHRRRCHPSFSFIFLSLLHSGSRQNLSCTYDIITTNVYIDFLNLIKMLFDRVFHTFTHFQELLITSSSKVLQTWRC